jgi:hypothetical protein
MNLYNNYNSTNIKNLPQIDQIIDTDFLVVENYSGTNKLRFKDFVISPNNTSFYNSLKTDMLLLSNYNNNLNTDIIALSTLTLGLSTVTLKNLKDINDLKISTDNNFLNVNTNISQNVSNLQNLINNTSVNLNLSANFLNDSIISNNQRIDNIEKIYPKIYNDIITFRWNKNAIDLIEDNFLHTFVVFNTEWPYRLKKGDILYVKHLVSLQQDEEYRRYNGSLDYNIETMFFQEDVVTKTYKVSISSNIIVPNGLTEGFVLPNSQQDTRKTFAIRIFTSDAENFINYI